MQIVFKPLESGHWKAIRAIYLEGIATGQATFETEGPTWHEWDEKHLPFARIVAVTVTDGAPVGWAALSAVSARGAYVGVAEVSVYVAANSRGQGVGRALLEHLIAESESNGIWTLQAGIFPDNLASMKVHQRCGFRTIGLRERIARLHGIWRDTLILERRSEVTGND